MPLSCSVIMFLRFFLLFPTLSKIAEKLIFLFTKKVTLDFIWSLVVVTLLLLELLEQRVERPFLGTLIWKCLLRCLRGVCYLWSLSFRSSCCWRVEKNPRTSLSWSAWKYQFVTLIPSRFNSCCSLRQFFGTQTLLFIPCKFGKRIMGCPFGGDRLFGNWPWGWSDFGFYPGAFLLLSFLRIVSFFHSFEVYFHPFLLRRSNFWAPAFLLTILVVSVLLSAEGALTDGFLFTAFFEVYRSRILQIVSVDRGRFSRSGYCSLSKIWTGVRKIPLVELWRNWALLWDKLGLSPGLEKWDFSWWSFELISLLLGFPSGGMFSCFSEKIWKVRLIL